MGTRQLRGCGVTGGEHDALWLTERARRTADAVGKRGQTDSWGKSAPLLKKQKLTDQDHADAALTAADWALAHRCPPPAWDGRWGDGGLVAVVALAGFPVRHVCRTWRMEGHPSAAVYRAWRVWRHAHDRHVLGELLLQLHMREGQYRLVRFQANGTRIKSGQARRLQQSTPAAGAALSPPSRGIW